MKDSEAKKLADNIQKLSILLTLTTTHIQHLAEDILSLSNAITEMAFTVEDIFKGLPPEVYKKLKAKKVDLSGGSVDVSKESLVSLIQKMLKGGRIKP